MSGHHYRGNLCYCLRFIRVEIAREIGMSNVPSKYHIFFLEFLNRIRLDLSHYSVDSQKILK